MSIKRRVRLSPLVWYQHALQLLHAKSMGLAGSAGFSGCATSGLCGAVAPHVADLACAGSESSVLQCPMAVTDDVFCAPEESVVLSCSGAGDPVGKPL